MAVLTEFDVFRPAAINFVNSSLRETGAYSNVLVGLIRQFSLAAGKILWRVRFHGTRNIPNGPDSGLVIASNHQSYIDPFLIGIPIRRKIFFMAWDKAFDWLVIVKLIRKLGAFPVDLGTSGKVAATKKALSILREGNALMVFPEAAREFSNGKLLPFKAGAVRLALESGVPILPVTVKGANRVWSRDHKFPRPGRIEIYYHPLLELKPTPAAARITDSVAQANEELRRIISSV